MGPKNKKSAKSTDKSDKSKGKDTKNTSDTTNITKQETVKPKVKAKQRKIDFPVTPTEPKEKVKSQQIVKPKAKTIRSTQQKLNFTATTSKTTSTSPTASTSFSTAANVQCSTPPPPPRPLQPTNVQGESPYSDTSTVFVLNRDVSKRKTIENLPTDDRESESSNDSGDQANFKRKNVTADLHTEHFTKTTVHTLFIKIYKTY